MDASINGVTASAVQYSPSTQAAPVSEPTVNVGAGVVASAVSSAAPVVVVPAVTDGTTAVAETDGKPAGKSATPSLEQVQKAVDDINTTLQANPNTQSVQFAIDPASKKIVVQMIDTQTGKVLSQYPSEEIIQMGLALGKKIGQLVNQQA